ncbi:nuclear transcription factor Y subunit B-1 isoform X2 [Hyalella azteca]|uniref:Nuclear transcription factor Y subunit B-1 isoform X2 n=1 Tax=Hyalella azteca TaxID=294128 RepID=A0A8B7N0X7_HYAAZ|nr:nuclear transcription factor Y subunit B-1 isoform X2 [Hyalella azteca]
MMESGGPEMDLAMSFLRSEMDASDDGGVSGDQQDEKIPEVLREQDRFLPIANVARIMKKCIPRSGKVAKDARECVQECISEFISFITSEASDRCHQEKRKTINGEDILWAMNALGFENYVEPLKIYLQKFREGEKVGDNLDGTYEVDYGGGGAGINATFTTEHVAGQGGELVCSYSTTHHHQQQQVATQQQQQQQQHQFTL